MRSKSISSGNHHRREALPDGSLPAGEYLRVPVCCAECEKFWKAMILEVTKTHTSAAPACEMRTSSQGIVSGCMVRIRSAKPLRVRNFPGLSNCMPNSAPGRSLSWTTVRRELGPSPTSATRPNFEPRMSRGSSLSLQNGTQRWKHVVPTYVGPSHADSGVCNPSPACRTKRFNMAQMNSSPSPSHLSGADRYTARTSSYIKNTTTMSTNLDLHTKAESRKVAESSGSHSSQNFQTKCSDDCNQGKSKEAFNRTPRLHQQQHQQQHSSPRHDEPAKSGFQKSPSSQYSGQQKKATSSPKSVSDVKKVAQQDEPTPTYVDKAFKSYIRPLITPEMAPTSQSSGFETFDAGHGDQSGRRNLSRTSTDQSGYTSLSMGRATSRCSDHARNLSRTSTCASSVFEPIFLFTGHSCPSASEDSGDDDSVITNPNYFKSIITNISSYSKLPLTLRVPKSTLNPSPQP